MRLVKIVVFVPLKAADEVRKALGDAGAGNLGDYTHCSWSTRGQGRFTPQKGADPDIGQIGQSEVVEEERIEVICERSKAKAAVNAMKKVHPYEEVAYEIYEIVDEDEL